MSETTDIISLKDMECGAEIEMTEEQARELGIVEEEALSPEDAEAARRGGGVAP